METIFGNTMMVLSITMVVIGLPRQILKNRHEGRCGQDLFMILLPFGVWISRIGYAITIHSWYLLVPDLIGALLSCILLSQYWSYRKNS